MCVSVDETWQHRGVSEIDFIRLREIARTGMAKGDNPASIEAEPGIPNRRLRHG